MVLLLAVFAVGVAAICCMFTHWKRGLLLAAICLLGAHVSFALSVNADSGIPRSSNAAEAAKMQQKAAPETAARVPDNEISITGGKLLVFHTVVDGARCAYYVVCSNV